MFRRNKILVRIVYTPDEYKEFIYNIDTDKVFHSYQYIILSIIFLFVLPLIFNFGLLVIFGFLVVSAILYGMIILVLNSIYDDFNITIKERKQYDYVVNNLKKDVKLLNLLEEVDKDEKCKFVRFLKDVRQRYSLNSKNIKRR